MDDDFKVAVHLMLEDGVSDALADIMAQLAAADRAIAATAVNWEGLRFAGDVPHSPVLPDRECASAGSPVESPHEVSVGTFGSPVSRLEPMSVSSPATLPALAQAPPELLASLTGEPDLPLLAAPTWVLAERPIAPDPRPEPRGVGPNNPSFPGRPFAVASVPQTAPLPNLWMNEQDLLGPAAVAPLFADLTGPTILSQPPRETISSPIVAALPSAPMLASQTESIAPRDALVTVPIETASIVAPENPTRQDTMSTAPAGDMTGIEGQLLLDGSLLGRWVIDYLGQEATRAPAGGGGFDSRLGRPWT